MSARKVHPRAAEGERTRKEILRVAVDLFAEKGYAKTSITDIAERAHTYRSSVDWHFGSKEGLLLAVIDDFIEVEIPLTYKKISENFLEKFPEPTHDQLMTTFIFDFLASLLTRHFPSLMTLYRVTFEEAPHNQKLAEKIKKFWSEYSNLMIQAIKDGQANGTLSKDIHPEWTSRAILAIEQGMFMQWYLERDELDAETSFSTMVNGIMRLLMLDPADTIASMSNMRTAPEPEASEDNNEGDS